MIYVNGLEQEWEKGITISGAIELVKDHPRVKHVLFLDNTFVIIGGFCYYPDDYDAFVIPDETHLHVAAQVYGG